MANAELIECVKNTLVRTFLQEHLDEFASDVRIFNEHILAHVPPESKSFIKNAGLAFYSAPIIGFVPDLPWQTIKTTITNAVSEVVQTKLSDLGHPENVCPLDNCPAVYNPDQTDSDADGVGDS